MEQPDKIPVSAAIIACNEEAKLPACLSSLRDFDDVVVVVDARTTDGTARVAEDFRCSVFIEEWMGFDRQKQMAVDRCRHDHVLLIDADERLSPGAADVIRQALQAGTADAYSFRRKNHVGGRWIKHSGWWPDRVVRLLDRRKCRVEGSVHEKVVVDGRTAELDAVLEHYSYENYSEMAERVNHYSSLSAAELFVKGKKANRLSPFAHAGWMFFRTLVVRRGFLDGFDGFAISFFNAYKTFLKYLKLLEMRSRGGKDARS